MWRPANSRTSMFMPIPRRRLTSTMCSVDSRSERTPPWLSIGGQSMSTPNHQEHLVHVMAGRVLLEGNLTLPREPRGLVLFAHGSGSSRHSSRNRYVAEI